VSCRLLRELFGAPVNLDSVVFSPDGRFLAAASINRIRVWDAGTGRLWRELLTQDEGTFALAFTPDGRTLLSTGRKSVIRLWELETASQRRELSGHTGAVFALALSRDGRTLASAGEDKRALLYHLSARPQLHSQPVDLERAWAALASADAADAENGLAVLASSAQGVSLLAERIKPVEGIDSSQLERLLADLDHSRFVVRRGAEKQLEVLGPTAETAIRRRLRGNPTLEVRRRGERLLDLIAEQRLVPDELRAVRAIELLEQLGSRAARGLLERLTRGASGAPRTKAARAALARLAN
jgi:WD domain, G-beta repeat